MRRAQRPGVKYAPGMGSAPAESRLRELLLPPPMVGLKMGVLGTTAALTVAEGEEISGTGGRCWQFPQRIQALRPAEPAHVFPLLPFPVLLPHRGRGASFSQKGQPETLQSLLSHIPGRGTNCVPSEGGMVKPDSQIGEFAP